MVAKIYNSRLIVTNESFQETRSKVFVLDQKIYVLMQSILKAKRESDFRALESDVSRMVYDVETLYITSVKSMQQSSKSKGWDSTLCGMQVLIKNIHIVKNHACRFREFARLSESASKLTLRALESLFLSDKARLSEKRKIKEEFAFIKNEVEALIETFGLSAMTPSQEVRYDALIETMDDLQSLIFEL